LLLFGGRASCSAISPPGAGEPWAFDEVTGRAPGSVIQPAPPHYFTLISPPRPGRQRRPRFAKPAAQGNASRKLILSPVDRRRRRSRARYRVLQGEPCSYGNPVSSVNGCVRKKPDCRHLDPNKGVCWVDDEHFAPSSHPPRRRNDEYYVRAPLFRISCRGCVGNLDQERGAKPYGCRRPTTMRRLRGLSARRIRAVGLIDICPSMEPSGAGSIHHDRKHDLPGAPLLLLSDDRPKNHPELASLRGIAPAISSGR